MKMTGVVTRRRKSVIWIKGEDGGTYYGYTTRKLRPGIEVGFDVNLADEEVADHVMVFGLNPEYSIRDNIVSAAIGLIVGAIAVFLII